MIGLIIILIYTIICCFKFKQIPTSLSETYYLGAGNWFCFIFALSSFLIAGHLFSITPDIFRFLCFFASGGMLFVGIAPKFKDEESTIHVAGATMLLLSSQIWLCLYSSPWILLTWLLLPLWINLKQRIFWCEITVLINTIISLII